MTAPACRKKSPDRGPENREKGPEGSRAGEAGVLLVPTVRLQDLGIHRHSQVQRAWPGERGLTALSLKEAPLPPNTTQQRERTSLFPGGLTTS